MDSCGTVNLFHQSSGSGTVRFDGTKWYLGFHWTVPPVLHGTVGGDGQVGYGWPMHCKKCSVKMTSMRGYSSFSEHTLQAGEYK